MLPKPEKVDRYIIQEPLGKGAMGTVYRAVDPTIDRDVAVKTIHENEFRSSPDGEEMEARFRREIHTAGLLTHSNIVTIYDGGKDGRIHWIAMEYVDGPSLSTLLKENTRVPVQATLDIIIKVADAIDFAHRKNIIHRDLKPGNILLTSDGEPKLADFGIARIESSTMTQTGVILGTPSYMSPEQVKGHSIDSRSDLFSLGIILYEMLTGQRPFKGESPTSIMYQIVHEEVKAPHVFNKEVPVALSRVVLKSLAKNAKNRYQTGAEFSAELREIREGGNLETTIVGFDAGIESVEIRPVPDVDTLSRLEALESNDGMGTIGKIIVFLLVMISITAGAYYAYLFFSDQKEEADSEQAVVSQEPPVAIEQIIRISANIQDADVMVDGENVGKADGTPISLTGSKGASANLVVSAECYHSVEDTFVHSGEREISREYTLEPITKMIRIVSQPAEASVYLGENMIGKTPLDHNIACGEDAELRIELDGYHSQQQTLAWQTVEPEQQFSFDLKQIAGGFLQVSAPYEVTVRNSAGTTLGSGNTEIELKPGNYNIRLTNQQYFFEY
jgi:serine/threonine protein kinase